MRLGPRAVFGLPSPATEEGKKIWTEEKEKNTDSRLLRLGGLPDIYDGRRLTKEESWQLEKMLLVVGLSVVSQQLSQTVSVVQRTFQPWQSLQFPDSD